jgi:hypothetical protein
VTIIFILPISRTASLNSLAVPALMAMTWTRFLATSGDFLQALEHGQLLHAARAIRLPERDDQHASSVVRQLDGFAARQLAQAVGRAVAGGGCGRRGAGGKHQREDRQEGEQTTWKIHGRSRWVGRRHAACMGARIDCDEPSLRMARLAVHPVPVPD